MKLLFVADLHYSLKQFDWLLGQAAAHDLVVIGGDLLDLGSSLDIDVQIAVVEKYLHRLRQQTRVVVSSGNHDGDSRNENDESVALWLQEARANGLFVDGDRVALPGVVFTACPWWDGPLSRKTLEEQLVREAALPREGKWIWVHHAPPAGSPVCWTGRKSAGDEVLREWIARFRPDMVLSGHIHDSPFHARGAWIDRIEGTWVFNPGRQPGPCPSYLSLDFGEMTVDWTSFEGRESRVLGD